MRIHVSTLIALSLCAGTSIPVHAQNTTNPEPSRTYTDQPRRDARAANTTASVVYAYRTFEWLNGRDIIGPTREVVGEVKDLIVDRGSGRIRYVVIDTNERGTPDGRDVAVSFSDLATTAGDDRLTLLVPLDRLVSAPAYKEVDWAGTGDDMSRAAAQRWAEQAALQEARAREVRDQTEELRENAEEAREDAKERREEARENAEERREEARENAEEARERAEERREEARENAEEAREERRERAEDRDNDDAQERVADIRAQGVADAVALSEAERDRLNDDAWRNSPDIYHERFDMNAQPIRIEGTVDRVTRRSYRGSDEQVIVRIRKNDGTFESVAFGPAWFVNSATDVPTRGQKIAVVGYAVRVPSNGVPTDPARGNTTGAAAGAEPDYRAVASSATIGSREIRYRDQGGRAAWISPEETGRPDPSRPADARNKPAAPAAAGEYRIPSRYVLASTINGADVSAAGEDCGSIENLIIEMSTGHVAMVSIDPDQNFLGVGDTSRLIPWNVVSISADGNVRVDATKDMLLASMETPEDLMSAGSVERLRAVYSTYQVDAPTYRRNDWRSRDRRPGATTDANPRMDEDR